MFYAGSCPCPSLPRSWHKPTGHKTIPSHEQTRQICQSELCKVLHSITSSVVRRQALLRCLGELRSGCLACCAMLCCCMCSVHVLWLGVRHILQSNKPWKLSVASKHVQDLFTRVTVFET